VSKYANMAASHVTHGILLDLHAEIKNDTKFEELFLSYGLLWEDVGNEPRGYSTALPPSPPPHGSSEAAYWDSSGWPGGYPTLELRDSYALVVTK